MNNFSETLQKNVREKILSPALAETISSFYETFKASMDSRDFQQAQPYLLQFLNCVLEEVQSPYTFEPYHSKIREPFDYYQMGVNLFRPLVIFEKSRIEGEDNLARIEKQLSAGDNVIFLANHQAEPDPQVISLLLEKKHPELAENMIFVAGHRVVSDPLAKPFSKGRNLLCIYSKRYIENPPEHKEEKLLHNQQTMKKMVQLLSEGGKCIYMAPSGGRDRLDASGKLEVAPFDTQSIEMFWLMSKQTNRTTHFYPMSLFSYYLLPPPESINKELGEQRRTQRTPIHLAVGAEIDMENFPGSDEPDKKLRREKRANYIWQQVKEGYEIITKDEL